MRDISGCCSTNFVSAHENILTKTRISRSTNKTGEKTDDAIGNFAVSMSGCTSSNAPHLETQKFIDGHTASAMWSGNETSDQMRQPFPVIPDFPQLQKKEQVASQNGACKDPIHSAKEEIHEQDSDLPDDCRAELLDENGEIASWSATKCASVTDSQDGGKEIAGVEQCSTFTGRTQIDTYLNEGPWNTTATTSIQTLQPDSSHWVDTTKVKSKSSALDLHDITNESNNDRFAPLSPKAPAFNPGNTSPSASSWPGLMTMTPDEVKGLHSSFSPSPSPRGYISTGNGNSTSSPIVSPSNDDSNQSLVLATSTALAQPPLPLPNPYHTTRQAHYSPPYGSSLSQVGSPHGSHSSFAHHLNYKGEQKDHATKNRRGSRHLETVDGHIYHVHFKRAPKNFILSPLNPTQYSIGDIVKVEADRGEDVGTVMSRTLVSEFKDAPLTAGFRGRGFTPAGIEHIRHIIRPATAYEKEDLLLKAEEEEMVLQNVREMVMERGIYMSILDVEYQFDHHKLTVFFEADRRVDFRDLVSELFSLYKTRIWMQQVEVEPKDTVGFGLNNPLGSPLRSPMRSLLCTQRQANQYRTTSTLSSNSTPSPAESPGRPLPNSPLSFHSENGSRVSPASRTALSSMDSLDSLGGSSLGGNYYHQSPQMQQSFDSSVLESTSTRLSPDCWYPHSQGTQVSQPTRRCNPMNTHYDQQQQIPYRQMPYIG